MILANTTVGLAWYYNMLKGPRMQSTYLSVSVSLHIVVYPTSDALTCVEIRLALRRAATSTERKYVRFIRILGETVFKTSTNIGGRSPRDMGFEGHHVPRDPRRHF